MATCLRKREELLVAVPRVASVDDLAGGDLEGGEQGGGAVCGGATPVKIEPRYPCGGSFGAAPCRR